MIKSRNMDVSNNLLVNLKIVYNKTQKSSFNSHVFDDLNSEIQFVSEQMALTKEEAFFFSIIFCLSLSDNSVNHNDIINHLECNSLDIMEYMPHINSLFKKRFVRKQVNRHSRSKAIMNVPYQVDKEITEVIFEGRCIEKNKEIILKDASHFIDYVSSLIEKVVDDELDIDEALASTENCLIQNEKMPFVKAVQAFNLKLEDICILVYYISKYRIGDKHECIQRISKDLFGNNGKAADLMQNVAAGNHILVKEKLLKHYSARGSDEFEFQIASYTKDIMRQYGIIPVLRTKVCDGTFDFLYEVNHLFYKVDDEILAPDELCYQLNDLISTNNDLSIVTKVQNLNINGDKNLFIYLKSLYDGATNNKTNLESVTEAIYSRKKEAVLMINEFIQEQNQLLKNDLLDLKSDSFFSRSELVLTEISEQLLADCDVVLPDKMKSNYSILPEDIKVKPLFYNDQDANQLNMLKQILEEDNYHCIQKRMAKKSLPTGVIALLYGEPGTGKTESVYQFAKHTKREVIQVDISQSKSMWFGESEKQIKKIFTRYEQYSKRCKIKPILLFNEADAIISKRKDTSSSNVAQTENAIQNILLEEFENFSGICIATTNLINNLDPAFERRFLYKIELTKPDTQTLSMIWRSKLSSDTAFDTLALAEQYPFSGGQIDNIVKKIEMHEILHGVSPSLNEVKTWCNGERFENSNRKRIGY